MPGQKTGMGQSVHAQTMGNSPVGRKPPIGISSNGARMIEVRYLSGVFLPGCDLWLDPRFRKPRAFVSHAHADHTGRHGRIICTPETAAISKIRFGQRDCQFEMIPYHESFTPAPGWTARLLPAGHALGSAQFHVDNGRSSLLYTGDFKGRTGRSATPVATLPAETLIMETTYGRERYRFPPTEETMARVEQFCVEVLDDGDTPVLMAYAFGKAQELLCRLSGRGFKIMVHRSISPLLGVYREAGVVIPECEEWAPEASRGRVVVCPPGAQSVRSLRAIPRRRVAALTGWALDPGAIYRLGCEVAFPLSDHADYDELLEHVSAVSPRCVLTLHGYASEFAADLRARGWEAWALTGDNQLEWPEISVRRSVSVGRSEALPDQTKGVEQFARTCEMLRQSSGKKRKIKLLADYLCSLPEQELPVVVRWLSGRPLGRQPIDAGSQVVRRALARACRIPEAEVRVAMRRENESGIAASSLLALHGRSTGPEPPSINEVDTAFSRLAASRTLDGKADELSVLLQMVHPVAGGYLVRLIGGNLRIGLREGLLEEAVSAAFSVSIEEVRDAHQCSGDLAAVASASRGGQAPPAVPVVGNPLKVMLASAEPSAERIWERLGGFPFCVEDKLDGIRAQLHVGDSFIEVFSRDQHPIGSGFPEILDEAHSLPAGSIFDGELLAWRDGCPLPFRQLQSRLGRRTQMGLFDEPVPVIFCCFDLLLWKGEPLVSQPLSIRRRKLEMISPSPHISIAPARRVNSPEALWKDFRQARSAGFEGLVVKRLDSPYLLGKRGSFWIKLKEPQATLDVVVTAAEYGHGKRRHLLSDYTFAVRDHDRLVEIGKAYSGLTGEEIESLTGQFLGSALSRHGNRLAVEPIVVLEVAFDSIHPSPRHQAGLALRFPRILRVRTDKSPEEIDSLETCRRIAAQ